MFIDEAKIYVKAGDGGKGSSSFRREKFVPKGGPDGGDGGNGGNVIVKTTHNLNTLLDFRYNQHHNAKSGGSGLGSEKHGKNGEDRLINVPIGTVVKNAETLETLEDMDVDGMEFIVAKGGMGGRGNTRFKTSTNRAPRYCQPGMPGEELRVLLELKLLADVGIIGYPNAGKSTLISRISSAKPKIADYPFTTIVPNLGVVKTKYYESFVVADIPGIIKGAHTGKGLGIQFLKHIQRTKFLLHVIDMTSETEKDPLLAIESLNSELEHFDMELSCKPQIIIASKMDIPEAKERLEEYKASFKKKNYTVIPISSATGEGLDHLIEEVAKKVRETKGSENS